MAPEFLLTSQKSSKTLDLWTLHNVCISFFDQVKKISLILFMENKISYLYINKYMDANMLS